ncbi:hypothetical protein [Gracilibacillus salinarum]|uniref:ABC transporter permease n=1 Tax=Gracilibacillus salinarum TaxID=2932255 RepID=A0ABY4GHD3_9BACI|nr:hypothetical protein [Gracilibacillus salinarum]UOQ83740.1 hypothetical protein MUN87_13350 [Gracilibacillus salinarum]
MNKTLTRLLQLELKKALTNKFFSITLSIASIFTLLSAWYMIDTYYQTNTALSMNAQGNPLPYNRTLYKYWIGGETSSLGFTLFFTLFPLIAVLPYGWSHVTESKNGYVKMIVTRSNKWHYYVTKFIATFTAGGTVILLPLILNFIVVASFVPAISPTQLNPYIYGVENGAIWSNLFYTHPLIYTMLYLLLDFIFAGLFATMSLAISFFIKNRIAIILIPFFLLFILHYSRTFLQYKFYKEISPLNYLHAIAIENPASTIIILIEGMVLFVLTFGITMRLGVKREIF